MKVLIIYQYFQDKTAPGHSLTYELAQHLTSQGHQVTVVAGETGYMSTHTNRDPWYRRLVRTDIDANIRIIRTYSYSELHRSYLGRLLSFITFSLTCPLGILIAGRQDVALASSPPIFPAFTAWIVCRIKRIPFVFEVRDLWPASAVQMGLLKNKTLIAVTAWVEGLLYDKSNKIIALTEGIKNDICERGWTGEKVELVTCGVDPNVLYPDGTAGFQLRLRHDWTNKIVVLYFGALGEANNIPVILRTAKRLETNKELLFVLVGNGMKRAETVRWLHDNNSSNVLLLPPVSKEQARDYINSADICLVTLLNIPLFDGAIPTKLLDYMACAKPVLCGVKGEAQAIVEKANAGYTFDPDSDEQLAALIVDLSGNPDRCAALGSNGKAFVERHFSADKMREQAEVVLTEAATLSRYHVSNGN